MKQGKLTLMDHLLVCLNEEAVEVAQECDKALRFGLDDIYSGESQRRRLAREINQFLEVLDAVKAELPELVEFKIKRVGEKAMPSIGEEDMEAKRQRLVKYVAYARKAGRLL